MFLTAVILLFLGRVVGLPVTLVIVSGRSMLPTLQVGDLVVGVKSSFRVGDVVIWCASPTYCVIHRVIKISGNVIVTKGDNNPAPDPPIPKSLVKYKVVLIIRKHLWLPAVLGILAVYAYANRDYFRKRRVRPGDVASLILTSFIVFNAAVALLAPTYYPLEQGSLAVPRVTLRYASMLGNGNVVIALNTYNTRLINVTQCLVGVYGSSKYYGCSAEVLSPSQIVVRGVPPHILENLLEKGGGPLLISIKATILFGELRGTYYVYPSWRKPLVKVTEGTVIIANPNPAPLRVNVTTLTSNKLGPANVTSKNYVLAPHSVITLNLSKYRYAYVRIEYFFRGKHVIQQLRVRP